MCSAVHLLRGEVMFFPPVGLHEDAVDLVEASFALAIPDGFKQGADAQVACAAQVPFGGADDECECVVGEGAVSEAAAVELVEDEGLCVVVGLFFRAW